MEEKKMLPSERIERVDQLAAQAELALQAWFQAILVRQDAREKEAQAESKYRSFLDELAALARDVG